MNIRCAKCEYDNPPETRFCGGCGTKLARPSSVSSPPGPAAAPSLTQTLQMGLQELQIGSMFAGRYLILESLGRGGMGRVYRALDKKLDVEVAVKLLRPEIAADEGIIQRFKNELKLARMVSHPHVCRMYDLSEDQGTHFITMEYVPGEDLKTTVRRVGPLGLGKALSIARQVCEGLAAAHRLDIVHRDLKPQNIMLDGNGQVRIMDFGISRSLRAKGITADGMMIGTPEYISPEQAEGKKIDARTDIYAFGAILFEMVTGKVPFDGETTLSIILKHKLEPPPDPRKLNPRLPKEVGQIILKCLEKDRERRYPSADALCADLVRAEAQLDGKQPAKADQARPGKKRLPVIAMILAAAAVVIAGIFLIKPFGSKKAGVQTPGSQAQSDVSGQPVAPAVPASKPAQKSESKTVPASEIEPVPALSTAPAAGIIEITTVPAGVGVFLNGKLEGQSPLKRSLTPGVYEVRIKKPSEYREVVDKVTLRAGQSLPKHYILSPVYILEVRTVPPGAYLNVDGVLMGKTPVEVDLPRSGIQFGLRLGDEWAPISEAIKLRPGRNRVERVLQRVPQTAAVPAPSAAPAKPRLGKVRFNVQPYAEVFIDGKSIGEIPPVKTLDLAEGTYALKFDSPRLKKSLTLNLTVKPDDRVEVRVNIVSEETKVLPWKEGSKP